MNSEIPPEERDYEYEWELAATHPRHVKFCGTYGKRQSETKMLTNAVVSLSNSLTK